MPYLLLYHKLLLFLCSRSMYEKASWKTQNNNKHPMCPNSHDPTHQREEHILADPDILRVDTTSGTVIELTCCPEEAMQDEDGYMTLNIKTQKPAVTSDDPTASSWWRVMALTLLILCMGMVVGLVALGIMSVTQQNYLQAEKEKLSGTLQRLARHFCQDLLKQAKSVNHKCNPCDPNWRYYGDGCYGFFRHNLTWQEGKQYCSNVNATLLKITSRNILEYLKDRTGLIRWVGLSRQNSSEDWMWEDGSVLSKTVFELSGEARENMNCAYFHDGKIYPTLCKKKHYLMCERKAGMVKLDQLL